MPLWQGSQPDEPYYQIGTHGGGGSDAGTQALHLTNDGGPQDPVANDKEVSEAGGQDCIVAEEGASDEEEQKCPDGDAVANVRCQLVIEAIYGKGR